MATPASKILLIGATGYVGGTVLDHFMKSTASSIQNLPLDLLVRGEEQAERLQEAYGDRISLVLWKGGLADTEFIADTAANYDIIINTGYGFSSAGARAFVRGLARRVSTDALLPWFLHISGSINLADRPITQEAFPEREWDDSHGEVVYDFLKSEEEKYPFFPRTTELGVLALADVTGVQAVSVNTPCVFGEGTGFFNKQGVVIPTLMRYIITHGYGFKLTDSANFDWVHVEDLADVFILLVRTILERPDHGIGYIPSGKKGILFPAVGRVLQTETLQRCLDAAFDAGVLPRLDTPKAKEIRQLNLQQIAGEITAGCADIAESAWAGYKAQKGVMCKKILGWEPKFKQEAWEAEFPAELAAFTEGKREFNVENFLAKGDR